MRKPSFYIVHALNVVRNVQITPNLNEVGVLLGKKTKTIPFFPRHSEDDLGFQVENEWERRRFKVERREFFTRICNFSLKFKVAAA